MINTVQENEQLFVFAIRYDFKERRDRDGTSIELIGDMAKNIVNLDKNNEIKVSKLPIQVKLNNFLTNIPVVDIYSEHEDNNAKFRIYLSKSYVEFEFDVHGVDLSDILGSSVYDLYDVDDFEKSKSEIKQIPIEFLISSFSVFDVILSLLHLRGVKVKRYEPIVTIKKERRGLKSDINLLKQILGYKEAIAPVRSKFSHSENEYNTLEIAISENVVGIQVKDKFVQNNYEEPGQLFTKINNLANEYINKIGVE